MHLIYLIALALAAAALLILVGFIGLSASRRGRDLERSLAEGEQMRSVVAALQAEVAELKKDAREQEGTPREFVPAAAVTAEQRAGALEMLRGGADAATVSATLGLSQAEADLLQKVQKLQDSKRT